MLLKPITCDTGHTKIKKSKIHSLKKNHFSLKMRICFVTSSQETTEDMIVIGLNTCTDINGIQLSESTSMNVVDYG